jgi:glycosyltransferase involved in cell wall biosynthesis
MYGMSKPTAKRICFISSRSGWLAGSQDVSLDTANSLLIEQLAVRYPTMTLALIANPQRKKSYDRTFRMPHVYKLPTPFSYAGGLLNTFRFYRILREIAYHHDVLIVQLPFIGFLSLVAIRKPTVYHVCANVLTAAANPVKYRGLYRIGAVGFARVINRVYQFLFKRSDVRVLVNGGELGSLYAKAHPQVVVSSSIQEEDILPEEEIAIRVALPIRILFVGRPSLEKGFDTLIESLIQLPVPFILTVVGFSKEEFQRLLPDVYELSKGVYQQIHFMGYLGWHEGLKTCIQQQDIAIVPSRSEGTPRVILECLSQGVAVIATRVGGIPSILGEGYAEVLIEPGSAHALSSKIMEVWGNLTWRKELILYGLEKAKKHTVQHFANHFIHAIGEVTHE